jgi:hypothetical protein
LYGLEEGMDVRSALATFDAVWVKERQAKGEKASLARVLVKTYWRDLAWAGLMISLFVGFSVLTPAYFVSALIEYVQQETPDLAVGLPLVFGMFLCDVLRNTFMTQYWVSVTFVGSKMRAIVLGMIV